MKPNFILPVVTAVLGFSAAWLLKPAPEPPAAKPVVKSAEPKRPSRPSEAFAENGINPRSEPAAEARRPTIASTPADEIKTLENRDAGKMLRLAEALGLSPEQQNRLRQLVDEALKPLAPAGGSFSPAEQYAAAIAAGENLKNSLNAFLTPEQATAFQDLLKRAAGNKIESESQQQLAAFGGQIDLSPEQRAKALERIRTAVAEEASNQPPALSLVLDDSVLPTGPAAPSARGLDALERLAKPDAAEAHSSHLQTQMERLDKQLALYQDILSPAQLAQLKATIEERKANLGRVAGFIR